MLPDVMDKFKKKYPNAKFYIYSTSNQEMIRMLKNNELFMVIKNTMIFIAVIMIQ